MSVGNMQVGAVIARLKAMVPDLRSVEGAAEMQALIRAKALPQVTPAAHVIPVGLRGGAESSVSAPYVQDVEETVGIVLTFRATDPASARALEEPSTLIWAVLGAVLGWGPDDQPGVFRLVRAGTQTMETGTLVYLIEIAIQLQLRID